VLNEGFPEETETPARDKRQRRRIGRSGRGKAAKGEKPGKGNHVTSYVWPGLGGGLKKK